MGDTVVIACDPKTSSGYIRGGDGKRATTEGAGATAAARGEPARGRGEASRGGTSDGGVAPDGVALGGGHRARWRGSAATPTAVRSPAQAVRSPTSATGAGVEGRGARGWLSDRAVDTAEDRRVGRSTLHGEARRILGVALAARSRLERAAAERPGARAQRAVDCQLEGAEVAGAKKIAARQGRVIVFVDESGLSERSCRARTWAPRGETPVLQYRCSWKQLAVIAGISRWPFYFRLFPGTIKSPQIIELLKALRATIGRKLLIVWDGLQTDCSKLVREYVDSQGGAIALERLPAYAPRAQPGRIHLGLSETSCHAELLWRRSRRCRRIRTAQTALDAAPTDPGARILATGRVVLRLSLTPARLNKLSSRTMQSA